MKNVMLIAGLLSVGSMFATVPAFAKACTDEKLESNANTALLLTQADHFTKNSLAKEWTKVSTIKVAYRSEKKDDIEGDAYTITMQNGTDKTSTGYTVPVSIWVKKDTCNIEAKNVKVEWSKGNDG